MLPNCLKYRKNTKSKNPKDVRTKNGKICFYQNVQCVIVKNQNLTNSRKLVDN